MRYTVESYFDYFRCRIVISRFQPQTNQFTTATSVKIQMGWFLLIDNVHLPKFKTHFLGFSSAHILWGKEAAAPSLFWASHRKKFFVFHWIFRWIFNQNLVMTQLPLIKTPSLDSACKRTLYNLNIHSTISNDNLTTRWPEYFDFF